MLSILLDVEPSKVAFLVVPAAIVQFIVTVLIPLLTGLITKISLGPTWKAIITLILTTLTAIIAHATQVSGDAVFTMNMVYNAAVNFIIAWAMYANLYKPVGLTSSTTDGKLGPYSGIGPAVSPPTGPPPS